MLCYVIIYTLSVLIAGAGAIYLLRDELATDRWRIQNGYAAKVTWLNIIGGVVGVFLPIFNTIISGVIICVLLDRPVVTKGNNHGS